MNYYFFFPYSLLAFGLVCIVLFICANRYFKIENITKVESIPRNIILGSIFTIIDIAWCIPQALPIFGTKNITGMALIAIVCIIIACSFLDYLFARALAAFFILLAHFFLWQSFAADIPYMWLFSIACYVMGTFGIIIGAFPHLLRDLLRKLCSNRTWRHIFSILLIIYAIILICTSISLLV